MKLDFKIVSFLFLKSKYDFQFYNKMNFTYPVGDLAVLGTLTWAGDTARIFLVEKKGLFQGAVGFYNH